MKLTRSEIRLLILEALTSKSYSGGTREPNRDGSRITDLGDLGLPGVGVVIASLAAAEMGEILDPTKEFVLPVPVTSTATWLGSRAGETAGRDSAHTGDDWRVPINTPVASVGNGFVASVVTNPGPLGTPRGNCGCAVTVQTTGVGRVTYCHLNSTTVKLGDRLTAGQVIGVSGGRPGTPCAGRTTGPHLHFSIGGSTDPAIYDDLYSKSSGWSGEASLGGPTSGSDKDYHPGGSPSPI